MKTKRLAWDVCLTLMALMFVSCGVELEDYPSASYYFSQEAQNIRLEIFYEPDAKPIVAFEENELDPWDISQANLQALFQYRSQPPQITVPHQLEEMNVFEGNFGKDTWTPLEVRSLMQFVPEAKQQDGSIYVFFLSGFVQNEINGSNPNVIGVNVSGTPIVAVFKDVVRNNGLNEDGILAKYIEQSTLVHEIGHVLGLVNNGIPVASDHADPDNGAHTTDEESVMYYKNEGAASLLSFIANQREEADLLMWGDKILQDVQSFTESLQ